MIHFKSLTVQGSSVLHSKDHSPHTVISQTQDALVTKVLYMIPEKGESIIGNQVVFNQFCLQYKYDIWTATS